MRYNFILGLTNFNPQESHMIRKDSPKGHKESLFDCVKSGTL
jgi:hypothetical protein